MVEPASIAAKAGFQAGDKIVSVNGIAVKDWSDAQTEMVLNLEAGPVKSCCSDGLKIPKPSA